MTDGYAVRVPELEVASHRSTSPVLLAALSVGALLGALATETAELVALAAPLALTAVGGLIRRTPPAPEVSVAVDRLTTIEGEPVTVTVEVRADDRIDRLEVVVETDGALAAERPGRAVLVRAGEPTRVEVSLPCERWGVGVARAVVLRWRDPAGALTRVARADLGVVVRVLPAPETVRTLLRTDETQLATGNTVARQVGQGLEFGEVRRYAPGDQLRAINWRVSARHDGLWVTDRHPERNVDAVLVVDALLPEALAPAVRAAAALADAYLAERDRVGLVGVGGTLRWLRPGGGARQRHRIVEELVSAQAYAVEWWAGSFTVPFHGLPPGAVCLALSSLLDDRSAGVLLDLRDRGYAMAVLRVDVAVEAASGSPDRQVADRLWRLARDARGDRLRARGVPVVDWRAGEPLEAATAELAAYRRALRRPAG